MTKGQQIWRDDSGSAYVHRPVGHVVVVRFFGSLGRKAASPIEAGLQREIDRGGRVHMFWDLQELVAYDSQVRVRCTDFLLRSRGVSESLHAITRSKLVAMGVSVVSLALGGIVQVHPDRTTFDAALQRVVNNPRAQ